MLVFLVDSTPTRQLVRRCCGTRDQRHLLTSVYDLRAPLAQPVLRGTDRHHIVEAAIKALGLSLRDALADTGMVFSTKGSVRLDITEE